MATPPPVTLTFHMSGDFVTEVTGAEGGQTGSNYTGVWVYLYNDQPPSGESNFTTLIDGGQLQSGVTSDGSGNFIATIDLTNTTTQTINGGVVYLLVQSEALTTPGTNAHAHDLTTLITAEADIAINVSNYQYGYSQFEYSLLGQGGDAGDLTAIPGFAQNTQIHVSYSSGPDQYRGYGQTQTAIVDALKNSTSSNVLTYAAGELAGDTMMVISPSNVQMGGGGLYPPSDWNDYVTEGFAAQHDLLLSGSTNGENDANGVWHNGQYYSYKIQSVQLGAGTWGSAGQYFVFSPKEGSQTQAWMVISEADLQSNLYSAGQGSLYIYEDPYLTQPYTVPGSGSPPGSPDATFVTPGGTNDEFGNILTQAFTGFTAGYWATVANQSNPYNGGTYGPSNWAAQTINLNNNANWDAAYAFDNYRDVAVRLAQAELCPLRRLQRVLFLQFQCLRLGLLRQPVGRHHARAADSPGPARFVVDAVTREQCQQHRFLCLWRLGDGAELYGADRRPVPRTAGEPDRLPDPRYDERALSQRGRARRPDAPAPRSQRADRHLYRQGRQRPRHVRVRAPADRRQHLADLYHRRLAGGVDGDERHERPGDFRHRGPAGREHGRAG